MGSIPLPALAVQPPPQQDPMGNMGKLLQLKGMLGQQQMQPGQLQMQQQAVQEGQLQLQDKQAASIAMHQWDGKDINELPALILKNGGSAQAVFGMKNQIVSYQKNLAEMTKDQLANEATKNDTIAGHIDTVKALPAEQQPQAFEAAKT